MFTELHWIDGPWPGRLAISARPRGGDWLGEELAGWVWASVGEVVSLLTPDEVESLGLQAEADLSRLAGLDFRSFPIVDRSVPASERDVQRLIDDLDANLGRGKNIAIHCRQGVGRAGMVAASLLVARGLRPDEAFERVSMARGIAVPETEEQRSWVEVFAREVTRHPLVKE